MRMNLGRNATTTLHVIAPIFFGVACGALGGGAYGMVCGAIYGIIHGTADRMLFWGVASTIAGAIAGVVMGTIAAVDRAADQGVEDGPGGKSRTPSKAGFPLRNRATTAGKPKDHHEEEPVVADHTFSHFAIDGYRVLWGGFWPGALP